MFKPLRIALAAVLAATGAVALAPAASADDEIDVYSTEGVHHVNGREWRTSCEPYSVTKRCRTEIKATVVAYTNGTFVQSTGWAFNNLTYLPSPRTTWAGNPLAAHNMDGFVSGGRNWRTECDTERTGRNGCRSYLETDVIAQTAGGFEWQRQWVFNSMVRFSGSATPAPAPAPSPDPIDEFPPIAASDATDVPGWEMEEVEGVIMYTRDTGTGYSLVTVVAIGSDLSLDDWVEVMDPVERLGTDAVCGHATETDGEICVVSSAKYGSVLVLAMSASRAEMLEVVAVLRTDFP